MCLLKNKIKEHYHWVILAILLIQSIVYGSVGNAASVYVIPITETLQISRGLFSSLGSITNVVVTITTLVITRFLHKFGFKKTAIVSMSLFALSCVISGLSSNTYIYAISRVVYGVSCSALSVTGIVWLMRAWIHKHYGMCLGVVTMGTGIGGMISSVVSAGMIESLGWQWSYVITGLFAAATIPLYLLVRNTPKEMGLKPYGEGQLIHEKHKNSRRMKQWKGVSVEQTQRHPAFKIMCILAFLLSFCLYCPWYVVAPHFRDNGYTAIDAAAYQSFMMLALAIVKFICGFISEKIGGKALAVVCIVCTILGHIGFADVSNPYLSYLWMVLLAVSMTLTSVSIPLIIEAIFGIEAGSRLVGTFMGISTGAAILAAPVCNMIFDIIGSYSPIFMATGALNIVWLIMLFVVFRMYGKVEKQWLLEHRT